VVYYTLTKVFTDLGRNISPFAQEIMVNFIIS